MGAGPAVGEKAAVATGADTADIDVAGRYSSCKELLSTDFPEIEIAGSHLKMMQMWWDFPLVIQKFTAAGTQRGADGGEQVGGIGAKVVAHSGDGVSNNIFTGAPPARVDTGDDRLYRILQEDGLTVGLQNQEADTGFSGDHTVAGRKFSILVDIGDDGNQITMDLAGGHQVPYPQLFLDPAAMFAGLLGMRAGPRAQIACLGEGTMGKSPG